MTLTGTFVLAYSHASDLVDAIRAAVGAPPAVLGLLVCYLTRPPEPGTDRAEIAAAYGMSIGELRAGHRELAERGHLLQLRRCVGRGQWQHLIVVVDTPGQLPGPREAWLLLDASLAAEQAVAEASTGHTPADSAHVATCDDTSEPQAATCDQNPHIKPVNPFSSDGPGHDRAGAVVATVADLTRLAQLPPLPAPTNELAELWLSPGQVLSLLARYPARYGDLALAVLARAALPWYLAPRVVALLVAGYDTGQLGRTLAGVQEADCPAAVARWRLDRMLLADPPSHIAWRPPSTYVPAPAQPAEPDAPGVRAELAAARAAMAEARARMRSGARA